jgi:hypothetical protein
VHALDAPITCPSLCRWGQQDDSETVAITMVGEVEYRFATDVRGLATRRDGLLEFIQRDPRADRAVGIARVVAHPSVVADLIERLSAVQGVPRD